MIKALQLIFSPSKAWTEIAVSERGVLLILLLFVLPLLLPGLALEGFSLWHWGERRDEVDYAVSIGQDMAVRYAVAQSVLLLASILAGGMALQWIMHSFQARTTFTRCFTVMAYGFSPVMLARYFDAVPKLNTWVCWSIGALLSATVLYHGVGLVMRPEQTKGFGLYLVSIIVMVLFSGLSHFVALSVLHGKMLS
jgi:hypothetical protein